MREWRREHAVIEFATLVKSQRRIRVDVMAKRIGRTSYETERLLGKALDRGSVEGAVDRSADELVPKEETRSPQVFVGRFPWCGGEVNECAFPEEAWTCPYCERTVTTRAKGPEPGPGGRTPAKP